MVCLDGKRGSGVGDGGVDFGAVADDAGVGSESFAVGVVVCGYGRDVEVVERGAVAVAAV